MNKRKSFSFGFTIIELLIVIVVIGILSAIGIMSYSKVQQTSRDAKRSSSISTIAEALENYYQKNGEYPSCTMMSGDSDYVSKTVLSGNIAKDVLSTPTTTGGTNSIQAACADLNAASSDLFSYIGDSSTNCTTGTSCSNYVLKYKEENTGNIITVKSRYGNEVSFAKAYGETNVDSANALIQVDDGSYITAGYTNNFGCVGNDVLISKYSNNGTLIWSKTWGGDGDDKAVSLVSTANGDIVITGNTNSFGAGNYDIFLIKYTTDGNLLWYKTWGGSGVDNGTSVIKMQDSSITLTGYTESYGSRFRDAVIIKFSNNGDLLWSRTWGGLNNEIAYDITETADNSIIIAGSTSSYSGSEDAFISKFTNNGTLVWSRIYGDAGIDKISSIITTKDGGMASVGQSDGYSGGNNDVLMSRYTLDGELIWSKTWGDIYYDYGYSIVQKNDGGFYVAGSTYYAANTNDEIFITNLDVNGAVLWHKLVGIGGYSSDYTRAIINTIDGGFALTGSVFSYSPGTVDVWLIKYMPNGLIRNCTSTICKNSTAAAVNRSITTSRVNATSTSPSVGLLSPGSISVRSPQLRMTIAVPL